MLCECFKKPNRTRCITIEGFSLEETSTLEEIAQQLPSEVLNKNIKGEEYNTYCH